MAAPTLRRSSTERAGYTLAKRRGLGPGPADTARNKDSKVHTAIREGAKRFRYAFLYGAGAARAGHIICDIARAVHQIDSGQRPTAAVSSAVRRIRTKPP